MFRSLQSLRRDVHPSIWLKQNRSNVSATSNPKITARMVLKRVPRLLVLGWLASASILLFFGGIKYISINYFIENHLSPTSPELPYKSRSLLRRAFLNDILKPSGNLDQVIEWLQEAVNIAKASSSSQLNALSIQYRLADALERSGRYDEAIEQLHHILAAYNANDIPSSDENYLNASILLSRCWLAKMDPERAKTSLESFFVGMNPFQASTLSASEILALIYLAKSSSNPNDTVTLLLEGVLPMIKRDTVDIQRANRIQDSAFIGIWRQLNDVHARVPDTSQGWACLDSLSWISAGDAIIDMESNKESQSALVKEEINAKEMWMKGLDIAQEYQPGEFRRCDRCRSMALFRLAYLERTHGDVQKAKDMLADAAYAAKEANWPVGLHDAVRSHNSICSSSSIMET